MGLREYALRTISQLIQHTNQPLAHYTHTVKLITAVKHTISRSNSMTERWVSSVRICLSFNSLTRCCTLITQRRHNNSLTLCFNKSCFVMCGTFSQSFLLFDGCWLLWCFHLLPLKKEEKKRILERKHPWLNIKGVRYFKTDITSKGVNTFKGYHRKEIQKPASHL